jgi:cell shape-determining protein MreC
MKASSRRTSPNKRITGVIVVGVVALTLFWLLPKVVYVAGAMVMAPVNGVKTWFAESSASLPQYLRNRSVLVDELQALEQQLADRGGDRFTTDMLAKENAELRELLGDTGDERILAGVIGRPNALPYDMLLIDQGQRDGIAPGAPVYIGDRTVIGFVQSVAERTALVTLITTPDFTSTVYVLGPDIFTTAVGMGGGQLRVGVPQGIVVEEGDLVILPSVTSGVYGSVSHIETIPSQPEQHAYVSPKTPIGSLRLVAVGKTPMVGSSFDAALANVSIAASDLFTVPVPPGYQATSTLASSTQSGATTSAAVVVPAATTSATE